MVRVYTCQNVKLLEISCSGSNTLCQTYPSISQIISEDVELDQCRHSQEYFTELLYCHLNTLWGPNTLTYLEIGKVNILINS